MSTELKSTVAGLQAKVAYLETTLAQLLEHKAKKAAKRAARATPPLPQSETEGNATDTMSSAPKKAKKAKKAKKERDPDAPKKAPNSWIVFTMRIDALLKERGVAGKAVENKQFASTLKAKKAYDEWADEEILAEKASWTKPEVSKQAQAQAKSDAEAASISGESESKPKKVRGRPKKEKKETADLTLWNSGCEDLCYHFGCCSDVMGDCWIPVYEQSGLEGLKKELRCLSKTHHKNEPCKDCTEWIENLHD